jgi:hypothetical protein
MEFVTYVIAVSAAAAAQAAKIQFQFYLFLRTQRKQLLFASKKNIV